MRFIKNDSAALAAYIESQGQGLILFDGRPSAGKTTLAKAMAARIRCGVVDGDDFIVRDQRRFVGALKTDALRERIEASLAATPLVLLSTVCAREVATKVDMHPASWVWIERTSLTLLDIAVRDFADDFDADEPPDDDTLRQEVEVYIKAYDAGSSRQGLHQRAARLGAPVEMSITKLAVAEREIVAAVRLLFDGNDTVPIYVLAAAAREITTALCIKRGIESFLDIAQQEHAQLSRKELYRIASRHAGFFKHADRDADAS